MYAQRTYALTSVLNIFFTVPIFRTLVIIIPCENGGTGRRAGFRILYLTVWGFKSPFSHQPSLPKGSYGWRATLRQSLVEVVRETVACSGEGRLFAVAPFVPNIGFGWERRRAWQAPMSEGVPANLSTIASATVGITLKILHGSFSLRFQLPCSRGMSQIFFAYLAPS